VSFGEQPIAEMRTQETGSAGDKNTSFQNSSPW
jgi:hypothetical protein